MSSESTQRKPAPKRAAPAPLRAGKAAQTIIKRPAASQGWDTSDEHEIELRRWRGRTEITTVQALEPAQPVFGTFRARSESGAAYDVEIRSLNGGDNSCGCIDHQVNGLGTCKHIEGVLEGLRRRGVRVFRQAARAGPSRVELFVRRSGAPTPTLIWPRQTEAGTRAVKAWLAPLTPKASFVRISR
jgi:hypothetical protein